jgi:hypothetical protein
MAKSMNKAECRRGSDKVSRLLDQGRIAEARKLYWKIAPRCSSGLSGFSAVDCAEEQKKLRAARARRDPSRAWEISNTMRAHGCAVSLSGVSGKKKPKRSKRRARR